MKQVWKPSNMLAPVPAVLVTVRDPEGNDNVLTIAWAGTVCSDPAMVSISVRKERFSYPMIAESGEFVINHVNRELLTAADYCGVRSGRQEDKFAALGLEKEKGIPAEYMITQIKKAAARDPRHVPGGDRRGGCG